MSKNRENVIWQSRDGKWNRGFFDYVVTGPDDEWDVEYNIDRFKWVATDLPTEDDARESWLGANPGGHQHVPWSAKNRAEIARYEKMAEDFRKPAKSARTTRTTRRSKSPKQAHAMKSFAQLDHEIAEVLSRARPPGHSTQLANWWRKAVPEEDRVCYDTKTKALKAFLDTNYEIVEDYGGPDYEVSPAEFDAINHKYSLRGNRVARTIAQAVWAAMPEGKPFCLDRIDLDALNGTSPARDSHLAFRLPDHVYEADYAKEQERYYRSLGAHARICRRCRRPFK